MGKVPNPAAHIWEKSGKKKKGLATIFKTSMTSLILSYEAKRNF